MHGFEAERFVGFELELDADGFEPKPRGWIRSNGCLMDSKHGLLLIDSSLYYSRGIRTQGWAYGFEVS